MNRESFYVGLGMILVPLFFFLIYRIVEIQTQIDWGLVLVFFVGSAYFGTALFLLIKGALSEDN